MGTENSSHQAAVGALTRPQSTANKAVILNTAADKTVWVPDTSHRDPTAVIQDKLGSSGNTTHVTHRIAQTTQASAVHSTPRPRVLRLC